jgi:hypothetical protein
MVLQDNSAVFFFKTIFFQTHENENSPMHAFKVGLIQAIEQASQTKKGVFSKGGKKKSKGLKAFLNWLLPC